MNNDILELERIYNVISERLDLNKNQLSFFEKNKLIKLKKCLNERNRISYMAYFDVNLFKDSKRKEDFLKEYYDKIDNEKEQFNKNIYDLFKKVKHLNGYDEDIRRRAINEFLFDILCIKEKADMDKTKLLYEKFGRRRGENSTYALYKDLNNKSEGLDTTNFCDELFNLILESSSLKSEVYKIKQEYIDYNKTISDFLTIGKKDLFLEAQKSLKEKNDKILKQKIEKKEKMGTDAIFYEYLYIEKLKYFLYEIIECDFILKPSKIRNTVNLESYINNTILENIRKLDNSFKNTSKSISENSESYLENYEEKYKRFYKEDYFKIKIEELQKLNNEDFINKLEKYLYIYLAKVDIKNTIKDYLAINFISWLKCNDFIAELNMYIKILNELKDMKEKELNGKLNNIIKKLKKISIKEKMKKNLFKETHESFVSSKGIFIKEKLSYEKKEMEKAQDKSYIEILSKNYNQEYEEYKNIIFIKFIRLKLYLLKKGQEIYFNDFIEIIKLYSNALNKGLQISTQLNLKEEIDKSFYIKVIKKL